MSASAPSDHSEPLATDSVSKRERYERYNAVASRLRAAPSSSLTTAELAAALVGYRVGFNEIIDLSDAEFDAMEALADSIGV